MGSSQSKSQEDEFVKAVIAEVGEKAVKEAKALRKSQENLIKKLEEYVASQLKEGVKFINDNYDVTDPKIMSFGSVEKYFLRGNFSKFDSLDEDDKTLQLIRQKHSAATRILDDAKSEKFFNEVEIPQDEATVAALSKSVRGIKSALNWEGAGAGILKQCKEHNEKVDKFMKKYTPKPDIQNPMANN